MRPEQSKASGPAAAHTYGSPIWASATWTAFWAPPLAGPTGSCCTACGPPAVAATVGLSCTHSRDSRPVSVVARFFRSAALALICASTLVRAASLALASAWALTAVARTVPSWSMTLPLRPAT